MKQLAWDTWLAGGPRDAARRTICFVLLVAVAVGYPVMGAGETFPVGTAAEFQTALGTAAANGEDDAIMVAAGTYLPAATLTFDSSEPFSLTITGAGAGVTVLDGGDPAHIKVLSLRSFGANANLMVEHLTVRDGLSAGTPGGALAMETGSGQLTLADCEITDSSVTGTADLTIGGGATLTSGSGRISVAGCSFRRNTSAGNVGGLFAATASGSTTLSDCLFEDNVVTNLGGSDYFGDGGGAMLYSESNGQHTTVSHCTFRHNSAAGGSNPDGGGLMVYLLGASASVHIGGSSFVANEAGLGGGGLFVRLNAGGAITCDFNEFSGNSAAGGTGGGGSLHLDTGTLVVTGNTFTGNDAGDSGGGLQIDHGDGSATLADNSFVTNTAATNGGGLQLVTGVAAAALRLNIFRGNVAGNVGAGLSYATASGSLELASSTWFGNTAGSEGGGVYLYFDQPPATLSLTDLVLWHDQPDELGVAAGSGSQPVSVRYSDVEGGSGQPWFDTGCIEVDPLFVDAAGGNLHLSWDNYPVNDASKSPCIDSGDPASPPDPDGSRADMGALPFGFIFGDGFEDGTSDAWSAGVGGESVAR